MSQAFPNPGDLFQGRYRIDKVIGAGGFAQVYRAIQEDLEREVALKILIPAADGPQGAERASYSQKLVQRFNQEAKLVSRLRDPHTITMFDYGHAENGLLFMVFEYVNGLSLSQVINRSEALAAPRVIKILKQTLSSLHEAHSIGMLHRDLKPANIMIYEHVGRPDQVKLLDFGIAKVFSEKQAPVNDITTDGAIVGTPRYMSPEHILGKPLTPASDLYSLGLVAYEMLVGQKANDSHTSMTVIGRQLDPNSFALPPELAIPPELRQVIDKMLVKRVEHRWNSAAEVIEALEAIEENSTVRRITGVNHSISGTGPHHSLHPYLGQQPTHTANPPFTPPPGAIPIDPTPSGSRERAHGPGVYGQQPSDQHSQPLYLDPSQQGQAQGASSTNHKLALVVLLALAAATIFGFGAYIVFGADDPVVEQNSSAALELEASPPVHNEAGSAAATAEQGSRDVNTLRVTTHPTDLLIKIGDRAVGRSPIDIDIHGLSFPLTVTAQLDTEIESSVFLNRPDRPVFIDFSSQLAARTAGQKEAEALRKAEEERQAEEARRAEEQRQARTPTPRPVRPKRAPEPRTVPVKEAEKKEEPKKTQPAFHIPSMEGI